MAPFRRSLYSVGAMSFVALLSAAGGCGGKGGSSLDSTDDATSPDGSVTGDNGSDGSLVGDDSGSIFMSTHTDAGSGTCTGLQCSVPANCTTTLSGTVYDPAGKNPLYNVVVFIPNDPAGTLPAIAAGTHTCNTCDVSIGDYVAVTTTDAKGHFTLTGVPATTHVPLVVQTGKWRREVFLPSVTKCTNNPVPAASSRLPRNHTEGSLPQMALLTGGCDDLGCFMRSLGVDASEFTAPHGGGRLDVYEGVGGATLSTGSAGACSGSSCPLWANKSALEAYDMVILSCECGENNQTKPAAGMQALHDWLDEGGKVFASHYHYTWFKNSPAKDFNNVASWLTSGIASGSGNYDLDTTFPKGVTFHDWLANVNALGTGGTIALNTVATSVSKVNAPTQQWIYDNSSKDPKYLSFLTPIGGIPKAPDAGEASGPQYCGKAVFTDLHTSSSLLKTANSIPSDCSGASLTAQQEALEFLFFDLSACVADDSTVPPPPPPPAK
jgi:hypothetical protein